jgi:HTH-type transcriptional regulator/antitoxin HigA
MEINQGLYSDLPIPPGEYLEEVIEELGMSKEELAKRMNRPAPKLSAIFKGNKAITPDTALQLEKVVGVPAHIWTGLESEYRLALARIHHANERQRLKAESALVTRYRYADLVSLGIVTKKTRPTEKVRELHRFFGVTDLETVAQLKRYQAAFRFGKKSKKGRSPESIATWLRIGELKAQKRYCVPFNGKKLKASLDQICSMTLLIPEQFQNDLQSVLADAGVALVLIPHMTGTGIHGATFWIGPRKAVVMMTLRYKWADIFWFSLFHELGHILLHGPQAVILEDTDGDPAFEKQEHEANQFATDTLIPPKAYEAFLSEKRFYANDIGRFATKAGVAPGIIVGRLQHDGHIKNNWHSGLRKRFKWKNE